MGIVSIDKNIKFKLRFLGLSLSQRGRKLFEHLGTSTKMSFFTPVYQYVFHQRFLCIIFHSRVLLNTYEYISLLKNCISY